MPLRAEILRAISIESVRGSLLSFLSSSSFLLVLVVVLLLPVHPPHPPHHGHPSPPHLILLPLGRRVWNNSCSKADLPRWAVGFYAEDCSSPHCATARGLIFRLHGYLSWTGPAGETSGRCWGDRPGRPLHKTLARGEHLSKCGGVAGAESVRGAMGICFHFFVELISQRGTLVPFVHVHALRRVRVLGSSRDLSLARVCCSSVFLCCRSAVRVLHRVLSIWGAGKNERCLK